MDQQLLTPTPFPIPDISNNFLIGPNGLPYTVEADLLTVFNITSNELQK